MMDRIAFARFAIVFTLQVACFVAIPGKNSVASIRQVADAPSTESESNNTRETANSISVGSQSYVNATIGTTTDVDWFSFQGTAGLPYAVETFNVAGSINTNGYRLYLWIYDQNGTEIAKDISGAAVGRGNTNSGAQFTAATSGTFFVRVQVESWGAGTGPYQLRVLPRFDQPSAVWDANHEPNNWRIHASEIQVGALAAITSTIETRQSAYRTYYPDEDWYRFEAVQGQSYVVEAFNVAGAINTNGYRLYLRVYDRNGTLVAEDVNGATKGFGNVSSGVQFVATEGGTYFILAWPEDWGQGSGPYSLRVLPNYDQPGAAWDANQEPNNWASHAFPISVGRNNAIATNIETRLSAYRTFNADRDYFRFNAVAGQRYVVETFNVAGSVNQSYAMQLYVYDNNGTQVAYDDGDLASGNANSSVEFIATVGGVYSILAFPTVWSAGSGPYSLRVLPQFDQPDASWDVAMEPNNFSSTSYKLDISPCARTSSIVARNSAYKTQRGDQDWFNFQVENGKVYRFSVSGVGSQFGYYGLELILYDKEFSKIAELTWNEPTTATFTANYDGIYYAQVWPSDSNASGTYQVLISEPLATGCNGSATARAVVDGSVSNGVNRETGEVSVVVPTSGTPLTINANVPCPTGTPQNVTLILGAAASPMTFVSGIVYRGTITVPPGRGTSDLKVRYICNGQTITITLGNVVLIDPSGRITNKETGLPIKNARVELRKLPNALPDTPSQTRDCRTINTRGPGGWAGLPSASNISTQAIDPFQDALLRGIQQISPATNPQFTGADGRYAWDVVEGCWYIVVSAPGYKTFVSPYVGVPPAVTDLDIALEPGASNLVLLPLVRR